MSALVIDVVVPAHDEAASLPAVLGAIPHALVRHTYVVDNASTDDTAATAAAHGAIVVFEPRLGYGAACLRGVQHVATSEDPPDVVVFLRADGSDDPRDIEAVVRPIERQRLDFVIGSPTIGDAGSRGLADKVSRGVAVTLIRALYGQRYTDLGSFRAIRLPALVALAMSDLGPGWNVEMQVKAVKAGLRVAEVPVHARRSNHPVTRARTITESAVASSKMLYTIFRHSTNR